MNCELQGTPFENTSQLPTRKWYSSRCRPVVAAATPLLAVASKARSAPRSGSPAAVHRLAVVAGLEHGRQRGIGLDRPRGKRRAIALTSPLWQRRHRIHAPPLPPHTSTPP